MPHTNFTATFWSTVSYTTLAVIAAFALRSTAYAQLIVPTCAGGDPCYGGQGISAGIDQAAGGIGGIATGDPRESIINILTTVVSYLGLAAVVVIVIAGIYLIFSNGNDEAKEKAKKIIFYVILGMLLIIFASAIVTFVATVAASN